MILSKLSDLEWLC